MLIIPDCCRKPTFYSQTAPQKPALPSNHCLSIVFPIWVVLQQFLYRFIKYAAINGLYQKYLAEMQKCLIFIPIRNQFASVLHLRAFFEQRECSEYTQKFGLKSCQLLTCGFIIWCGFLPGLQGNMCVWLHMCQTCSSFSDFIQKLPYSVISTPG